MSVDLSRRAVLSGILLSFMVAPIAMPVAKILRLPGLSAQAPGIAIRWMGSEWLEVTGTDRRGEMVTQQFRNLDGAIKGDDLAPLSGVEFFSTDQPSISEVRVSRLPKFGGAFAHQPLIVLRARPNSHLIRLAAPGEEIIA